MDNLIEYCAWKNSAKSNPLFLFEKPMGMEKGGEEEIDKRGGGGVGYGGAGAHGVGEKLTRVVHERDEVSCGSTYTFLILCSHLLSMSSKSTLHFSLLTQPNQTTANDTRRACKRF